MNEEQLAAIKARQAAVLLAQTQAELRAAYVEKDQRDDDDITALTEALEAAQARVTVLESELATMRQGYDDAFFTMKNIVNSVPENPQCYLDASYRDGRKDAALYAQGWLDRATVKPIMRTPKVNIDVGQDTD